jgi:hypothetical protein
MHVADAKNIWLYVYNAKCLTIYMCTCIIMLACTKSSRIAIIDREKSFLESNISVALRVTWSSGGNMIVRYQSLLPGIMYLVCVTIVSHSSLTRCMCPSLHTCDDTRMYKVLKGQSHVVYRMVRQWVLPIAGGSEIVSSRNEVSCLEWDGDKLSANLERFGLLWGGKTNLRTEYSFNKE